jgi:inner membrane transporter RhtA
MNSVSCTTSPARASWLPLAALMISMSSIQCGAALAKQLLPSLGASGTTALRLAIASVLLMVVLRPWQVRVRRAQWPVLLGYGASLGLMNLLFYKALETVPLGVAVALEFSGPLAVALLGSRRLLDFTWVALAAAGLALLLPYNQSAAIDPMGALCALGAGACWALYILTGQKAGNAHGPRVVALGTVIGALLVVPVGVAHAGGDLLLPALLPLALAVALLSTAIPYSLEMIALTRMPASSFGMLMSLEPVFAALSGLLFLHEQLSTRQWLAITAVVIASAGTALRRRPQPHPSAA